ncbi:hypothetical protein [Citrobacter amalonaticus]|uniref:hypothetical protein n=1 Tax=Citrobacter amalonaticus TaxID=35703 RepID=UPI0035B59C66
MWRFRYYKPHSRKRGMMSFGSYPAVTLADPARQCQKSTGKIYRPARRAACQPGESPPHQG